ncbi:hypothetical protein FACS1894116_00640 [Betaproteobacteria bacterium]|nr:hypothetical protein FACS1894116_00640 [Betaproteobacteria bacterium]GHU28389.1 hypothetical protein FACS189497_03740 [Betaproteobacteria bacterium]
MKIDDNNIVRYAACFAPGTLIHTDQGTTPIENIRVGTRVLSQPEDGGERDYRPVINTVAHLDQQVYAVQVKVEGTAALTTIIATGNHPFWVDAPLVDGRHWMAAECLQPGFVLQLAEGKKAVVHAAGLVRRTQHANIGFAADDRAGIGIVLDLGERQIRLASDAQTQNLGKLELGEPHLTPVYNFEVDEFHTYYVGEAAVWVHNTNCAVDSVLRKVERNEPRPTCFQGGTYVLGRYSHWLEIETIGVGSWVLSRNEKTGEQAYRRVTKKFEHMIDWSNNEPEIPIYNINYITESGEESAVSATAEHPFWVNGAGWVAASKLKPGDKLEICDPIGDSDDYRPEGSKSTDLIMSGQRWQATVVSVARSEYGAITVYNIEVEEFHTYFVGDHGIWVHNKEQGEPVFIQKLEMVDRKRSADICRYRLPCQVLFT